MSYFSEIEVDGVVLPNVVSTYTFNTTGIHTVKYTLIDATKVQYKSFYECTNLISTIIPEGVQYLSYTNGPVSGYTGIFEDCSNLTNVHLPNSLLEIGYETFKNCNLNDIIIPKNVTGIDYGSFRDNINLSTVTILQDNAIEYIGDMAFSNCPSLTSINLEICDNLEYIYESAFVCNNLQSIIIPRNVTFIGYHSIACTNLSTIIALPSIAPELDVPFYVKNGGTLYVPSGSTGYDAWMSTDNCYLGYYGWTKVEQ